jgi:hypothetical protein
VVSARDRLELGVGTRALVEEPTGHVVERLGQQGVVLRAPVAELL